MLHFDPSHVLEMPAGSLDKYGRCVVCGRRGEHCGDCHQGHDYVRDNPQWVALASSVPGDSSRIGRPSGWAERETTPRERAAGGG